MGKVEARSLGQEAARRAEQERQQQARSAEQAKPAITQEQRDAARQSRVWSAAEEAGRKAQAADRAR